MIKRETVIEAIDACNSISLPDTSSAVKTILTMGPKSCAASSTPAEYIQGFADFSRTPEGNEFWETIIRHLKESV